MLAPGGSRQGFEDVDTGGGTGDDVGDVLGEGEVGVEGDPQEAGVAGEGERGVVECDCGVRVGLAFVRCKEGDRGLGGRNGESKVVSPQRDLAGMLAEGRGGGSKVRVGVGVSEVVGIGGSQRMGVWVGRDEVVEQCRGDTGALRDSCSGVSLWGCGVLVSAAGRPPTKVSRQPADGVVL